MKKILIVGDSHGNKRELEDLIMNGKFDTVFYLGDGIRDIEWLDEEEYKIIKIAGNNDYFSNEPKELIVVVEGIKFLLAHGHLYKVKWGLGGILKEASERKVDVVCFGHTHSQLDISENGIRLLNAGAFSNGHYIVLYIDNCKIVKMIKI